jgi:hypothetical protein
MSTNKTASKTHAAANVAFTHRIPMGWTFSLRIGPAPHNYAVFHFIESRSTKLLGGSSTGLTG